MSKPIIHIGIAVSTDGFLPTKSNILNIAATTGTHNFNQNVLPQYGHYKPSKFWEKFPDVWDSFKINTVSYDVAVKNFATWCKNFQGNLIACISGPEYYHLLQAMMDVCGECPFGFPMDVNSYLAAKEGLKAPKKIHGKEVTPLTVAQQRWKMITGGIPLKTTIEDEELKQAKVVLNRIRQGARQQYIWEAAVPQRQPRDEDEPDF
jgi:hypothetical protein